MIKIRKLAEKDVPFMLEWMHDEESKSIFQAPFDAMTEEDVLKFVNNSFDDDNQHFAIVDDKDDEYLGTISLKNIDYKNKNAEYAISTRKKARGSGCNSVASHLLLTYAFDNLGLNRVYLCVLSSNVRAQKFYEKIGFIYEGKFKNHLYQNGEFKDLLWYGVLKDNGK